MAYVLHVMFKSNERPWSTQYVFNNQPRSDAEAVRHARGMADRMGDDYQCALFRDGHKIELESAQ